MSKVAESIFNDAIERVKTPEVQAALHSNLIGPFFAYILDILYPYLIGVVGLWVAILLGIILLLVRSYRIQ
jgi:hypothetical protein